MAGGVHLRAIPACLLAISLLGCFLLQVKLDHLEHQVLNPYITSLQQSFFPPTTGCTCVNCKTDQVCGGLWTGSAIGGDPRAFQRIGVVVSHCLKPLDWLQDFLQGFPVDTIKIYSKCGRSVEGAPDLANIVRLPNIGSCDHTYAYGMAKLSNNSNVTGSGGSTANATPDVILFIKDDHGNSTPRSLGGRWRSLHEMLRITSKTGYACGLEVLRGHRGAHRSVYHETSTLLNFSLKDYVRGHSDGDRYNSIQHDNATFASKYQNIRGWSQDVNIRFPSSISMVCYGGIFAVRTDRILQNAHLKTKVLPAVIASLSRGNNIEESHFAERSWAHLLGPTLPRYQIAALRQYSTERSNSPYTGGTLMAPFQPPHKH